MTMLLLYPMMVIFIPVLYLWSIEAVIIPSFVIYVPSAISSARCACYLPKLSVFPLKLNLRWFQTWPGSGSKNYGSTFLAKISQVKQWYQPKILVMVYKPSISHFFTIFNKKCQILLQKYHRKYLKSNKTLLRLNFQGNQNSLHILTIVCLLNVHIRTRIQCVAGSKSKIPENLICYYHALNLLYLDRHLPGYTQATWELPPPRIQIQC